MSFMVHVCYIDVGPYPISTCNRQSEHHIRLTALHRRRPLLFINQARQSRAVRRDAL